MKSANKVLSVLLACSMLGASFAGTTAAAASKGPEEGAVMGKTMSSYVSPNMDLSYMQNAAPSARTMLRARAAADELPAAYNAGHGYRGGAQPGRLGHLLGLQRHRRDGVQPV